LGLSNEMLMARPSKKPGDQNLQIVLPVLSGEAAAAEASRRAGVSEQSVHTWKRTYSTRAVTV
jgi:transposase